MQRLLYHFRLSWQSKVFMWSTAPALS